MNNIFAQLPRNPFVSSNGFCINNEDEKIYAFTLWDDYLAGGVHQTTATGRDRLGPVATVPCVSTQSTTDSF